MELRVVKRVLPQLILPQLIKKVHARGNSKGLIYAHYNLSLFLYLCKYLYFCYTSCPTATEGGGGAGGQNPIHRSSAVLPSFLVEVLGVRIISWVAVKELKQHKPQHVLCRYRPSKNPKPLKRKPSQTLFGGSLA